MTIHEKRAWYGLAIAVVWSLALVGVFVANGATAFDKDVGITRTVGLLYISGIGAYLAMMLITELRKGRRAVDRDERDRMILSKVPLYSFTASIITLTAWASALSTVYSEEGQVPVRFLYHMVYSVMVVGLVSGSAGTLIAYWLAKRRGIQP
jgi:hypothetical protein